jgi:apolipoprotein N-acyltransferase
MLFTGLAISFCQFDVPAGLAATGVAASLCLGLTSLLVGLRRSRSAGDTVAVGVEAFFMAAAGICLLISFLAFFVINLDFTQRLPVGTAALSIFLLVSLGYVCWARWQRRVSPERTLLARPRVPRALENALLILLSALLFALSFPGFVSVWGIGPLAYLALAPAFIVITRCRLRYSFLYGALFGFAAHALFNYWLALFNPIALSVVLFFRVLYFMLLFPLLKLAVILFPRGGFLVQTALWTAYEFISAQGFIAYSYGILGYSQYLFSPILQIASLASVWGISLLVIAPGAYLGNALGAGTKGLRRYVANTRAAPIAYALVFAAALVFGIAGRPDTTGWPSIKVALIQSNIDPWVGGDPAYEESLRILTRLSEKAEAEKPDLVVWPETALVPALTYHMEVRGDQARYNRVIRPFLEFMEARKTPYLIGNNDREPLGRVAFGAPLTRSYNAVLYMEGREIRDVYRKTHLVPFTEHFPYRDTLPGVYAWLAGEDTHFYDAGGEENADKVFDIHGVKVSSLICFEDTFGEIGRRFTAAGAELLVNHTNDAWSRSEAAEMQHLAIAVFRAVETRRSLVRSTTSGVTAVISPSGEITDRLPPFVEDVLVRAVPLNRVGDTLYVSAGEWCGWLALAGAAGALAAGAALHFLRKFRRRAMTAASDIDKNV